MPPDTGLAAVPARRDSTRTEESGEALVALLDEMAIVYERMRSLAQERHEAVRCADARRLARTVARENEAVQDLAELEKRRIAIVARLAEQLGSPERSQTRVSWIAERLGGQTGQRLAQRAANLRKIMSELHRENEVVRAALTKLAAHVEGLWRQVLAVLNHARTYGRLGAVEPGPRVVSAVDVSG